MRRLGLLGLPFPDEYGGRGADPLTTMLAFESLGYGCRDNGLIFSLGAHLWSGVDPIVRFGTADQKARWLPGLCDGTMIAVQAMTEPGSGSDAYACHPARPMATTGSRRIQDLHHQRPRRRRVRGLRHRRRSKGWLGLTAFLVEPDMPGLSIGTAVRQDGPAHVAHERAGLRRLPGPRRTCWGRGARGWWCSTTRSSASAAHPRQRPGHDAPPTRGGARATPAPASSSASPSATSSRWPTAWST